MSEISGAVMDSPVGPLTLEASPSGLTHIRFGHSAMAPSGSHLHHLTDAAAQLQAYFAGALKDFDLALDVQGTAFQKRVWEFLVTIPYGSTMTYGQLAVRLGDKNLARAVGRANGANPLPIVRPCHRVIGTGNRLTGFGGGLDKKAFLLQHESRQMQLFQL